MVNLSKLIGKTIITIDQPSELRFIVDDKDGYIIHSDDCIIVTFSDGTIWKLAFWDYEGWSSSIMQEIEEIYRG